jgi:hypothetical protein
MMGTSLLILGGSILAVVVGLLIMIGAIPIFGEGKRKKKADAESGGSNRLY